MRDDEDKAEGASFPDWDMQDIDDAYPPHEQ